ncbi:MULTISPECIES: SDR family NAD(P)-dependent oxidoreductase [Nostocales]|uniref:SDR family oxidoreductase n=3 Tax=Nostocales TaxID=1161 RepID=A0A0C1N4M7_9CYAN|nr:SDR family oxidoreductase [Tolypothrix bouteillei]KAF3884800.1 SDR family oxidoreductase [Tolypothrix bouteillei VB521301]
MNIPPEEVEICLKVLQQISEEPTLIDSHLRFKSLIAKIYKNAKKESRRAIQQQQKEETQKIKAMTAMVQSQRQEQPVAVLPNSGAIQSKLVKPNHCYICKQPYTEIHSFYHMLCPACAELNYRKRSQQTDLTNRVALVTGGRIKIGYQIALRMLRDGARVIITTRFPRDCARRFSLEPDFTQWRSHLQIHGLDLRQIGSVEAFVGYLLDTERTLDIIINNAAQTIKRPLAFYQHLLSQENNPQEILSGEANGLITSKPDSILLETQPQYPGHLLTSNLYFPANTFDADGQQLDTRPVNSWLLKLDEVSTVEMLEVHLVNVVAPFILNSKLKSLLIKSPFQRRFIINVSAMEGQFNRLHKTKYHPHTNMAKAALNMMTRTSAQDYARDGIFMNSVDTGWITDENPYTKKTYLQETRGFYTPLDVVDGMARIYDPIVQGIENSEEPLFGHFLKDYVPYSW